MHGFPGKDTSKLISKYAHVCSLHSCCKA